MVINMNKKYFFFDIDGTLTDEKTKQVVPSALWTLHALMRAGHFVALASGRAHYKAIGFMREIGLSHMVCNGGVGLVINDILVENKPLDYPQALALYRKAKQFGYGVVAMLDDSIKVFSDDNLFMQQCGGRKEPTEYIIDKDFDSSKVDQIYKLYISVPIEKEAEFMADSQLGSLRYEKEYLMIQYDCKKDGIIEMMNHIHGDLKDVVVFGNDTNDLAMFDPRWTNIAMGNACEALKQQATYVCLDNVDDGIYHACRQFGWIDETYGEK